jgi:hypothetical protein
MVFTKRAVIILSGIRLDVSGCYKGKSCMCLPDVNLTCSYMSICAERESFNKLITLENFTVVSFMLHVHSRKAHYLHMGHPQFMWLVIHFQIFISLGSRVNTFAPLYSSVIKPVQSTVIAA